MEIGIIGLEEQRREKLCGWRDQYISVSALHNVFPNNEK
jgi:hypothetical protein